MKIVCRGIFFAIWERLRRKASASTGGESAGGELKKVSDQYQADDQASVEANKVVANSFSSKSAFL